MRRGWWGAMTALAALAAVSAAEASSPQRLLLVFAQPDDPRLAAQVALLREVAPADLSDRDLVVLHVDPDGTTRVIGGASRASVSAQTWRTGDRAAFAVVLVGKDGGEKWRDDQPARFEPLFQRIDSMPMRALEMKRNRPAG